MTAPETTDTSRVAWRAAVAGCTVAMPVKTRSSSHTRRATPGGRAQTAPAPAQVSTASPRQATVPRLDQAQRPVPALPVTR